MRPIVLALFAVMTMARAIAAAPASLDGTWSGDWTPKSGAPDSVTVQFTVDEHGRLSGKFLIPVKLDFVRVSFTPATGTIAASATDEKSSKTYSLAGKVKGTDITGTLDVGEASGSIRLIKWTYTGSSISN